MIQRLLPQPDVGFMCAQGAVVVDPTVWTRALLSADIEPGRSHGWGEFGYVRLLPHVGWLALIPRGARATVVFVDVSGSTPVERRLVLAKTGGASWFRNFKTAAQEFESFFVAGGALPRHWAWNPPPEIPPSADLVPVRIDSGSRRMGLKRYHHNGWIIEQRPTGVQVRRPRDAVHRFPTIQDAQAFCATKDRGYPKPAPLTPRCRASRRSTTPSNTSID